MNKKLVDVGAAIVVIFAGLNVIIAMSQCLAPEETKAAAVEAPKPKPVEVPSDAAQPSVMTNPEGTFIVGSEIEPGRYRLYHEGPAYGSVRRRSNSLKLLQIELIDDGSNIIVDVLPTDYAVELSDISNIVRM